MVTYRVFFLPIKLTLLIKNLKSGLKQQGRVEIGIIGLPDCWSFSDPTSIFPYPNFIWLKYSTYFVPFAVRTGKYRILYVSLRILIVSWDGFKDIPGMASKIIAKLINLIIRHSA